MSKISNADIIDQYRDVVVQIATPFSTGTGFYLHDYGIIVTNEHVVRDNKEVIIKGAFFDKYLAKVLYLDIHYDLAFIEAPDTLNSLPVKLADAQLIEDGDTVIAVGHPFNLKYTATQGIISNSSHQQGPIMYLQHDAALNPGNSGGPLINTQGEVVGVNTFIIKNGNSIGFSLPVDVLYKALQEYKDQEAEFMVRCNSCLNIVADKKENSKYCPICGAEISLISTIDSYQPRGVALTIEEMLTELNHETKLSRIGLNQWQVNQGSARINISYHEKSGLIVGDAYLCSLPKSEIMPLYEYLLNQNYDLEGLTLSVKGNHILLSLLIFDQYLRAKTAVRLFSNLMLKADYYDDVLIEQFKAIPLPAHV